ncbi:uncharacterized protein Dwil_GK11535 [Drosophila willistoni]|uniref:Uncharacterized protein n=2 Tax=Drosophila willistoni TaxID=7260 RepID=B4N8Y9_DROWI|nr:uncharacterized protein Dwil_GK11535 [Drosophila willistoni]
MNYLIQRGKVREQAISVPEGLPELLSDITREALRCQPTKECLCQFIIDYLHSVIVTREKAMVARSILDRALRQVDNIISDLCICDLSKEKTDLMAQVMEDCFRNFLEKRRCEMRRGKEAINFDSIDIFEELIYKCNFSDEEMAMSRPAIESAYKRFAEAYMAAGRASDGTDVLYQYFRDRELKRIEEMTRNQAAITIQAAWRGHWVRSHIIKHICTCSCMMEEKADAKEVIREEAARVIQRFFRSVSRGVLKHHVADPCGDTLETKSDRSSSAQTAEKASKTAVVTPSPTAVSAGISPKVSGAPMAAETTAASPPAEPHIPEESVAPETEAKPAGEADVGQETAAEAPAEEEASPIAAAADEEAAPVEAPADEASAAVTEEATAEPAEQPETIPTEGEAEPQADTAEASPPPPDEEIPAEETVPGED